MAHYSIYYDATVQVDVEAESEEDAETKADQRAASIEANGADGFSIHQIYLLVNVDTGEETLK
ncbi:MAG: hypothetical protein V1724_09985 [Chloroflexota bacterium]